MSDQNFQTPPLPPKAPSFTPSAEFPHSDLAATPTPVTPTSVPEAAAAQPQTMEIPADNFATRLKLSVNIYKTKTMSLILAGATFVGILLGAMMFGGGSEQAPQGPQGLLGVVYNPDIRENMNRCGTVSESYPCLVYVVNHSRNDKRASDFFDEAVRLTGRQRYMVDIENKQYVNTLIAPGYIAQIKIPPLR